MMWLYVYYDLKVLDMTGVILSCEEKRYCTNMKINLNEKKSSNKTQPELLDNTLSDSFEIWFISIYILKDFYGY